MGITAWYELNRDNITKLHCENKAKPQLKCNGRCYLKKQLKKLNQDSNAPATQGNSKAAGEDFPVFVVPDYIAHNYPNPYRVVTYFGHTSSGYSFLHESMVFHPPKHITIGVCL